MNNIGIGNTSQNNVSKYYHKPHKVWI